MSVSEGDEIAPRASATRTYKGYTLSKLIIQVKIHSSLTRRSTLNRVLRIKQLMVQEFSKRENCSAGSLAAIIVGLAQRYLELRRLIQLSRL
jgi:predicted transcriptional regulator